MEVDRDYFGDTTHDRITPREAAPIPSAVSNRDDPFRPWHGMIGAFQRVAHVFGDRTRYHQYIGVARRCDEAEPKAFDIVISIAECVYLEFASIA